MKQSNAIIAVVIVIVVIAAAAGAFLLMNPGASPSSSDQGGGATDIRPSGPEGSVSGAVVNTVESNVTNASALNELLDVFNASLDNSGVPDVLAMVAVTNNRTDDITLSCHNFTAKLENSSSVQALNNNTETVGSNTTVYIVLGFITNGVNITSINYSDGNISFTVAWTKVTVKTLPAPVIRDAPNATLSAVDNLTFTALDAWKIEKGGYSPMALSFENQSLVLALMTGTNNNTTSVNLKASDFWLDLGNGSWLQGEDRLNNNVPKTLRSNTTVPFLLGFRAEANATPTAIVYWPGAGSQGERITIALNQSVNDGPFVALRKIWDLNTSSGTTALGNVTSDQSKLMVVQLLVVGNAPDSVDLSGIKAWTLKGEQLSPTPINDNSTNMTAFKGKVVTLVFKVQPGDDITLLTYDIGNVHKYVWLRPLQPAA